MTVSERERSTRAQERSERLAGCLDRARAGDRSALDEIVRELTPLLWRVARSQGLGVEEAADAVQTTWLELLRALDGIRSPQALTGWLVTATRREAWRLRERSRRTVPGDGLLDLVPDAGPAVDRRLHEEERDLVLYRHFRQLSDRCRQLLQVVASVERPDYDVVSAALGMPRGSIGPTRGRCLAKLRELLLADPAWSAG